MMYNFRSISARSALTVVLMVSASCHHVEVAAWGRAYVLNYFSFFLAGLDRCAHARLSQG